MFNIASNTANIQYGLRSIIHGEISGTFNEERRVVTCDIFRKPKRENTKANFN